MAGESQEDALDAAEEIISALHQFGVTDRDILSSVQSSPDSVDDLPAAIADQGYETVGLGDDWGAELPKKKTMILQDLLSESPLSVVTDSTYGHKVNLEHQLDGALSTYGYGFEFQAVDRGGWVEPEHEYHPRAFRLVAHDGTDTTVATAAFRYPPHDGPGHPSNQFRALGTGLNEAVLVQVDLRMLLLDTGDEAFRWVVLDTDMLQEVESTCGDHLEVFGVPLVERGPEYKYGWPFIDPTVAVDHEDEFGVPEPYDTFKLEKHPVGVDWTNRNVDRWDSK